MDKFYFIKMLQLLLITLGVIIGLLILLLLLGIIIGLLISKLDGYNHLLHLLTYIEILLYFLALLMYLNFTNYLK